MEIRDIIQLMPSNNLEIKMQNQISRRGFIRRVLQRKDTWPYSQLHRESEARITNSENMRSRGSLEGGTTGEGRREYECRRLSTGR